MEICIFPNQIKIIFVRGKKYKILLNHIYVFEHIIQFFYIFRRKC